MGTYIDSYTGSDPIPMFLSFAIEQYKHYKGITGKEASRILNDAGVIDRFADYYDVLHTQSAQWLVEEMDEMVTTHKAAK